MANRAYLFNTPSLIIDPYAFRDAPGVDYVEVDGPGYQLPIPWMCFFRQEDLKSVVFQSEDDDGKMSDVTVRVPSTSVSAAIRNLEQALPLFEAIAGDAQIARRYWENARAFLQALPLPWLTLESLEVVGMYELASSEEDLVRALSGTLDALPYLKDFSSYTDGSVPYPPDVLTNVPGPHHNDARTDNAIALDVNAGAGYWHRADGDGAEGEDDDLAVPPRTGQRDLGTVLNEVEALLATRVPEVAVYYGFAAGAPAGGQPLKLLLNAPGSAMCDLLLRDQHLRMTLDGPIDAELHAMCAAVDIAWSGFVFASPERLTREFGNDIGRWVTLAPDAPFGN